MELTTEHEELKRSALKFVEDEINPYVDEWEENEIFPAHELFKKLGDQGFLGVTKPEKYGGSGLDYSYGAVLNEALAHIKCGGVPMAIVYRQICQLRHWRASAVMRYAMNF